MRYEAINRNNRFSLIYRKGKSFVSPAVVIYVFPNRLNRIRIGITAGKKVGSAVRRNRARRVIREAIYYIYPRMKNSCDYIFVARGKTPYMKMQFVRKAAFKLLSEGGFIETHRGVSAKVL